MWYLKGWGYNNIINSGSHFPNAYLLEVTVSILVKGRIHITLTSRKFACPISKPMTTC